MLARQLRLYPFLLLPLRSWLAVGCVQALPIDRAKRRHGGYIGSMNWKSHTSDRASRRQMVEAVMLPIFVCGATWLGLRFIGMERAPLVGALLLVAFGAAEMIRGIRHRHIRTDTKLALVLGVVCICCGTSLLWLLLHP